MSIKVIILTSCLMLLGITKPVLAQGIRFPDQDPPDGGSGTNTIKLILP